MMAVRWMGLSVSLYSLTGCKETLKMSHGPGRIERTIATLFAEHPSRVFLVGDIAEVAYPLAYCVGRRHPQEAPRGNSTRGAQRAGAALVLVGCPLRRQHQMRVLQQAEFGIKSRRRTLSPEVLANIQPWGLPPPRVLEHHEALSYDDQHQKCEQLCVDGRPSTTAGKRKPMRSGPTSIRQHLDPVLPLVHTTSGSRHAVAETGSRLSYFDGSVVPPHLMTK